MLAGSWWCWLVACAGWAWALWAVLTVAGLLAADRSRSLGHRAGAAGWWPAGSLERRRDCIAAAGIIGWTVRQTLFQRRAGVATLIAATAAGRKRYQVIDVPAELAWSIAAGHRRGWPTASGLGRRDGICDELAALNLHDEVLAQCGGGVEPVGKLGPDELMVPVHLDRPPHHPAQPGQQYERHHE